jgi:hypothetical protein
MFHLPFCVSDRRRIKVIESFVSLGCLTFMIGTYKLMGDLINKGTPFQQMISHIMQAVLFLIVLPEWMTNAFTTRLREKIAKTPPPYRAEHPTVRSIVSIRRRFFFALAGITAVGMLMGTKAFFAPATMIGMLTVGIFDGMLLIAPPESDKHNENQSNEPPSL